MVYLWGTSLVTFDCIVSKFDKLVSIDERHNFPCRIRVVRSGKAVDKHAVGDLLRLWNRPCVTVYPSDMTIDVHKKSAQPPVMSIALLT